MWLLFVSGLGPEKYFKKPNGSIYYLDIMKSQRISFKTN